MKNRYFYKAIILLSSLLFPVVVSAEDYYGDEGLLGETALREADSNSPKGITHFAVGGRMRFMRRRITIRLKILRIFMG